MLQHYNKHDGKITSSLVAFASEVIPLVRQEAEEVFHEEYRVGLQQFVDAVHASPNVDTEIKEQANSMQDDLELHEEVQSAIARLKTTVRERVNEIKVELSKYSKNVPALWVAKHLVSSTSELHRMPPPRSALRDCG